MKSILINLKNWWNLITEKPLYPGLEKYHRVSRVRYNSFWKYGQLNPLRREQNNPAWLNAQSIIDNYDNWLEMDYDQYDENSYLDAEDNYCD